MKKIIKNLRNQSEETKMSILIVSISLSAVILLSIWVHNFKSSDNDEIKKEASPFSALRDNLINGFKNIKESAPKW